MKTPVPNRTVTLTWLLLAGLATANLGCQVATTRQPIGSKPAAVSELRLDGIWRSPDGQPFFIRTLDAASGKLEAAQVATNEAGFVLNRHEILLRRQDDVLFANVREIAPQTENDYVFGRLTVQEDLLVLTLAAVKPLRTLALQGGLQAEITTNQDQGESSYSVVVTNGFHSLATRLADPGGWQWLDTANPVVLTRQRSGLN